jgi:hypothetical protein
LKAERGPTVFPLYQGGAAQRQAVGPQSIKALCTSALYGKICHRNARDESSFVYLKGRNRCSRRSICCSLAPFQLRSQWLQVSSSSGTTLRFVSSTTNDTCELPLLVPLQQL